MPLVESERDVVKLNIHPLTLDRWPDFVRLFGENGVGGGCWCMGWRLPSRQQYLRQKGSGNKKAMHAFVKSGAVPGLLAYHEGVPIGWCSVGPREAFPALQRSPSRRAIDSEPVWSITCVYIARSYRRRRLSSRLIDAAAVYVHSQGGRIVEGYPVPPKSGVSSTSYAFTGFVEAFGRAGFNECARRSATRPVVRRHLPEGDIVNVRTEIERKRTDAARPSRNHD
jgi:GNAT superfamily N-acetyltransferase